MLRKLSPATGATWALRAQSGKRVRNEFPGPLCPGGPKRPKRRRKSAKIVEREAILTRFNSVLDFLDPRSQEAPGTHFGVFLPLWAQRAQVTPCSRARESQYICFSQPWPWMQCGIRTCILPPTVLLNNTGHEVLKTRTCSYMKQTRVYPYPLAAESARPNPAMGAPDPANPLLVFCAQRGMQTMVSDHGVGRGQTMG